MKALASEIVRKLGKRLKWLKINVRELTGKHIVLRPYILGVKLMTMAAFR